MRRKNCEIFHVFYCISCIYAESMEQNAQYANEIKHLKHLNSKLENELRNSAANTGVDMPQILSVPGTVISSLARKVTNQITTQLSNSDSGCSGASPVATLSQFSDSDTLDDSMRKVNKYVRKRCICLNISLDQPGFFRYGVLVSSFFNICMFFVTTILAYFFSVRSLL